MTVRSCFRKVLCCRAWTSYPIRLSDCDKTTGYRLQTRAAALVANCGRGFSSCDGEELHGPIPKARIRTGRHKNTRTPAKPQPRNDNR